MDQINKGESAEEIQVQRKRMKKIIKKPNLTLKFGKAK